MYPTDAWLLLLNFYLIVCSGNVTLCTLNFSEKRLARAYRASPGESFEEMVATATKLVLEFERQKSDTESQDDSPRKRGKNKETSNNGFISIPMPNLSSHV